MTAIKWLLIGAGDIAGRRVAPALVAAPHSRLTAVCDLAAARATELAAEHDVNRVYTDTAQALAESGADAVYIATPQATHVGLCLQALDAGKHFLCEKPLGLNGAECRRLLAAARRSDRITSCSNYRRLSEQYKATAAMLERQEIGRLAGGWAVYSAPFYNPGKSPIRRALGSSRIKELGFYLIDIVHNFFGMPVSVMAQASTLNRAVMNDVDDIATVVLIFPAGELFTLVFSCHSPGTRHELELFGTQGRIYWPEWPPHGNGPVLKIMRAGTEAIAAATASNCHLPMIIDFVAAVRGGREPVCTLESAVKTEVITDAVFRAIESGRREPVEWTE